MWSGRWQWPTSCMRKCFRVFSCLDFPLICLCVRLSGGIQVGQGAFCTRNRNKNRMCKRTFKPWPSGTPNSSHNWSQVFNLDGVGYRLATQLASVGWSWIEVAWIHQAQIFAQLEPSFPPFGHLGQLLPSCLVIVRWLHSRSQTICMVFLRAGSTLRYRLATR